MATRTSWLICALEGGHVFVIRPTGEARQLRQNEVDVLVAERGAVPLDTRHSSGDTPADVLHLDSRRKKGNVR